MEFIRHLTLVCLFWSSVCSDNQILETYLSNALVTLYIVTVVVVVTGIPV